jgi:hypothetical protein
MYEVFYSLGFEIWVSYYSSPPISDFKAGVLVLS